MKRRLIAAGCLALVLLVAVGVGVLSWRLPPESLVAWRAGPPHSTWAMWQQQVEEWRDRGVEREIAFVYRPLDEIPIDLQLAVLVGEDINFFGHEGVDFEAAREAIDQWRAGRPLRGASTITQQLAKNLFLTHDRSLIRKVREAKIAWQLEEELGKRRILELYLNVIEFDEGVLGVDAATRHFYAKPLRALSTTEAAALAAAIPAPRTANPASGTRSWQARRDTILARMREAGWLRETLERERRSR